MAKAKSKLEAIAKEFDWCEIEGKAEPYCTTHTCALCPANKNSVSYNPNAPLIQAYREGRMVA